MILRKPYAFLIKHFRLINFLIAILSSFIIYRSFFIVAFFRDYVNNNYTGTFYTGFYQEYISPLLFFVLVITILGISAICLLFSYKKKKIKSYLFSLYYYILLLFALILIRRLMIGMEDALISAEIARICRDVSIIAFILQIPPLIIFLINGFGFNIGKYNFKDDLKQLEISEQDNEEVEITINQDTTKLKRTLRRFKREFLYYLKENKYIYFVIVFVLIGIVGFTIYKSFANKVNNEYKQNDVFVINNLKYRVEDSIITNLNYKGEVINQDKYYLVVKLYIENNSLNDATINYKNFRLETKENNYIYPDTGKEELFIDYAESIYSNKLSVNANKTYALIFEIDKKDIKQKYRLKISNGVTTSDDVVVGSFNYVSLTPVVIDQIINEGIFNLNDQISFNNSNLGNSTLTLSNVTITDRYVYDYLKCVNDKCLNYKDMIVVNFAKKDKTILLLDYNFKIDETVPYYNKSNDFKKFINNFVKIKYSLNNEEKYGNVENVTPENMKGKFALEISKDYLESDQLYLAIIIRNKEYLIKINN